MKNDDTVVTTNPSEPITEGQIGKLCELLTARLRKSKFQSKPLQDVIENQGVLLIDKMINSLTEMIDAVSGVIFRQVKVNRNQPPQSMLDATGRKQYTDSDVVKSMPQGEGEEAEVIFFKVGHQINDDDLEKEYELRGLKPADPYSVAKVNQDDPAFADTYPNGTHWKDAKGRWCFANFRRWRGDERHVSVHRNDDDWAGDWWFAGLRK